MLTRFTLRGNGMLHDLRADPRADEDTDRRSDARDAGTNAISDGSDARPCDDPDGRADRALTGRDSGDRCGWSVPLFAVHFSVGATWAWCSLHGA